MRISDWSSDVCSSDLALRFLDPAHLDLGSIVLAPGIMAEGTAGQRPGAQTPAIEDPIGGNTRMLEQIGVVMKQFVRSEEHTSELQSLMRISYAVICLNNTKQFRHTNDFTTMS